MAMAMAMASAGALVDASSALVPYGDDAQRHPVVPTPRRRASALDGLAELDGQRMDKQDPPGFRLYARTTFNLLLCWQPQRNSNPCLNLERVVS